MIPENLLEEQDTLQNVCMSHLGCHLVALYRGAGTGPVGPARAGPIFALATILKFLFGVTADDDVFF